MCASILATVPLTATVIVMKILSVEALANCVKNGRKEDDSISKSYTRVVYPRKNLLTLYCRNRECKRSNQYLRTLSVL